MTPRKKPGVPAGLDQEATQLDVALPDDATATNVISLATPTGLQTGADRLVLEPGTMLGDYRIEGKLGEGGMGVVYAAVHPLIGKRAAVKILKKELCSDPSAVERFIDEARAVNEIGHPNIVDIFTFGETLGGRSYLVMEWLKGQTLRERIEQQRLSLREVCAIIRQLSRALEAAHEKGIIHRDLKPDNVFLVDVRGELPMVKLLDFGIAKLARINHRIEKTATGQMVGTPIYIAPEQARGREIDFRVDIYSLGGVLFELLTGRTPFLADNAMDMVAQHLVEEPPSPSRFSPELPPEIDRIVLAMLAKDADARPSLAQVCAVLDTVNDRLRLPTAGPAVAEDVVTPPRLAIPAMSGLAQRNQQRDRKWMLAGAAVVAVVGGFLIVRTLGAKHSTTPSSGDGSSEIATVAHGSMATDNVANDAAPTGVATGSAITTAGGSVHDETKTVLEPVVKKPDLVVSKRIEKKGKLVVVVPGESSFDVFVDGKKIALGPDNEISLSPGGHDVAVRAPDMTPQKLRVAIVAGQTTKQTVKLKPITAATQPKPGPGSARGADDDRMLLHSGEARGESKQ